MVRQASIVILVALLEHLTGASAAWSQELGAIDRGSMPVSLVSVLANPSAYQNERVRTIGVLLVEPEASAYSGTIALFLTKEQREYYIYTNALSLRLSEPDLYEPLGGLNGKYVIVEGVVDALEKGHMGVYAAGLIDVNRIALVGSDK